MEKFVQRYTIFNMQNIKFGLKLWSTNTGLIQEAETLIQKGVFQYIELLVVPETDISFFQKAHVPYVIHVPHENWGVNIGNSANADYSKEILENCIQWADALKATCIVFHPGFGDLESATNFLKGVSDKRIVIENMPKVGMHGERMIGVDKEEMQQLMMNKFGFCLDLGHAMKAALSLKKDYKKYIAELLDLRPAVFHLSNGSLQSERDEHLNIQEGDYDIAFLLSCIQKNRNAFVTLETPRNDLSSLAEDKGNMKKIMALYDGNQ